MVKYIYQVVVLFFVFVGAVFYFGSKTDGNFENEGKVMSRGSESFPVLTITTGKNMINTLYGYSGTMDSAIVRQSITPIDNSKTIIVNIMESTSILQKLHYEVIDKESDEVYYTEDINALSGKKKKVAIVLNCAIETSREYILSITGTTNKGRRIHYYTRLKYYIDDTNLPQKIQFALDFHKNTFNKEKSDIIAPSLETDQNWDNSTLANVSIKSDINLVTWAKLNPEVISDIVPLVKEYNTETACIQLNYFIKSKTNVESTVYHVKEFYRIRYTATKTYLLAFERTMEANYEPKYVSLKKSQLKVGITNETDMDLVISKNKKHLYFVRGGVLYHYNMEKEQNVIKELYSVFSNKAKKTYLLNDEQEIRINKLDDEGNVFFTVFGYMARGEYEGRVAVILYKYSKESDSVEELVYLPMDTTYQQLKEDFDTFSYVNSKGIYYFTVANVVYSYNIIGKRLDIIAENITSKSFIVLKNKSCYAWSSSLEEGYGESITVFSLETDERREIKAPNKDTYIRLLGTIDSNVVYGFVKKRDIAKTADGTKIIPCYMIKIVDTTGKVLKPYKRQNSYVQDVQVNGRVLTIQRCKKTSNGNYIAISSDTIQNQGTTEKLAVSLVPRVTLGALTEWYIRLPSNYFLTREPTFVSSDGNIVTSERAVHLKENKVTKYYVYALGKILGAFESAAEAILLADEKMGVVVSSHHQLIWERGGSYLMNSVSGMELVKVSNNINSMVACAHMILKANHIDVDAKELASSKKMIYDMLADYIERPVNLTGITLEQALYFVSSGKPIIGMVGKKNAVVISEYTQTSVTIINPSSGKTEVLGRNQAGTMFENAGNSFVSYMN